MAIIYKIMGDCPACRLKNGYGNICVQQNHLIQGCQNCSYIKCLPLPPLNKRIIYLDQSFLSHAFRKQVKKYVEKSDLLVKLVSQQLLICPYSDIHELETSLWRDEQKEDLLSFIKQVARGYAFLDSNDIKIKQITKAFHAFINGKSTEYHFEFNDVFDRIANDWNSHLCLNLSYKYSQHQIEDIRERKSQTTSSLIKLFKGWRKSTKIKFDVDYCLEVNAQAIAIIDSFKELIVETIQNGLSGYLNSPQNSMIGQTLLHIDQNKLSPEQRVNRIKNFLQSPHFKNVPYIKISAFLCAMLKKKIKKDFLWLQNQKNAEEKLSGIYFDIEHIAIYAPYCNAIFVDKIMYDWSVEFLKSSYCDGNYNFKVFSANNWNTFTEYLTGIADEMTPELESFLKIVY